MGDDSASSVLMLVASRVGILRGLHCERRDKELLVPSSLLRDVCTRLSRGFLF